MRKPLFQLGVCLILLLSYHQTSAFNEDNDLTFEEFGPSIEGQRPIEHPAEPRLHKRIYSNARDIVHRVKRALFDWFKPKTTPANPEPSDTATEPTTKSAEIQYSPTTTSTRETRSTVVDGDDEDNLDLGSGGVSSSGSVTTDVLPPSHPVKHAVFRLSMDLEEFYNRDLSNRNSEEFQRLSQKLTEAIDKEYEALPGTQRSRLIGIKKIDGEPLWVRAHVDLVSTGFDDEHRIHDVIEKKIYSSKRLGQLVAKNLNFQRFGEVDDPSMQLPTCLHSQMQCDDGVTCIEQELRCNGHKDCPFGEDESGCPVAPHPEDELVSSGYSLHANFPPSHELTRCRADDHVRCLDGSVVICEDQKCDGKRDCPAGDDEENCPTDAPPVAPPTTPTSTTTTTTATTTPITRESNQNETNRRVPITKTVHMELKVCFLDFVFKW